MELGRSVQPNVRNRDWERAQIHDVDHHAGLARTLKDGLMSANPDASPVAATSRVRRRTAHVPPTRTGPQRDSRSAIEDWPRCTRHSHRLLRYVAVVGIDDEALAGARLDRARLLVGGIRDVRVFVG